MKTILIIGAGARELAIARAIKKSQHQIELVCYAPYINPMIDKIAECKVIDISNVDNIIEMTGNQVFDFAIIGPEAPLEQGIVDRLNMPCIGPSKMLAQIETSKGFCRELLKQYYPSVVPNFKVVNQVSQCLVAIEEFSPHFVIKASGLMGGKGVFVSDEHFVTKDEALAICKRILNSQQSIVIEQKLFGEEFSLISFSDGHTLKHMPLVQDNKRAYESDKGPNTGGMGSISFADGGLPFIPKEIAEQAKIVNEVTIKALYEQTGEYYKGILYGGFMYTPSGLKLIEYNARFGDPEALNLLALLNTDFVEICLAIIDQKLDEISISFDQLASVCKYIVPQGYPGRSEQSILHFDISDPHYYTASIAKTSEGLKTLGSRAVAVVGLGTELKSAQQQVENKIRQIQGRYFYRKDIGTDELVVQKSKRMQELLNDHG